MKITRTFDGARRATSRLDEAELQILETLEMDWRNLTARQEGTGRFDPALLDAALPHAFMLERVAPGSVRTRVAGQRLHDVLRMDPRGMLFTAFFAPQARDTAMRLAETAFEKPAIVGIPLTASRGLGRRAVRAEVLMLPMQDQDGLMTRVMGALLVSGDIGSRGLRFDIAKDQDIRCEPIRRTIFERRRLRDSVPAPTPPAPTPPTPAPQSHIPSVPRPPATSFDLPPRPVAPAGPRKPFLRLVVDNT